MNKNECFQHFGIIPRNSQWSWSGRNEDRVVMTIWRDGWEVDDDGEAIYRRFHGLNGMTKPGFKYFVEDMQYALDRFNGVFNVILVTAVDVRALPRQIKRGTAQVKTWRMQIVKFNPDSGLFVAKKLPPEPGNHLAVAA
jgi:hypothetical protein